MEPCYNSISRCLLEALRSNQDDEKPRRLVIILTLRRKPTSASSKAEDVLVDNLHSQRDLAREWNGSLDGIGAGRHV